MDDKGQVHDIFSKYYSKQKTERRGVKLGNNRGKYKSHMKKQTLDEKRKKHRLRQRKYQKKQKTLAISIKRDANLKGGGMLIPISKDNRFFAHDVKLIDVKSEGTRDISLISRMTRCSKEKKEVRSSQ